MPNDASIIPEMFKYTPKVNEKNPLWTRCVECGASFPKSVLRKKCPDCGWRGSLVIFYKWDLPYCPLCAFVLDKYNKKTELHTGHHLNSHREGFCPLCGSNIEIVLQCVAGSHYLGWYLDTDKYHTLNRVKRGLKQR